MQKINYGFSFWEFLLGEFSSFPCLNPVSSITFQSEEEKLSILVEREKDEIEMLETVLAAVENIETLHQVKRNFFSSKPFRNLEKTFQLFGD